MGVLMVATETTEGWGWMWIIIYVGGSTSGFDCFSDIDGISSSSGGCSGGSSGKPGDSTQHTI